MTNNVDTIMKQEVVGCYTDCIAAFETNNLIRKDNI